MLVYAQVFETIPNVESGPDTLEKEMQLMVTTADYDLRSYQSTQRYKGQLLRRGLVFDDTLFTSYTQVGQQGPATGWSAHRAGCSSRIPNCSRSTT